MIIELSLPGSTYSTGSTVQQARVFKKQNAPAKDESAGLDLTTGQFLTRDFYKSLSLNLIDPDRAN